MQTSCTAVHGVASQLADGIVYTAVVVAYSILGIVVDMPVEVADGIGNVPAPVDLTLRFYAPIDLVTVCYVVIRFHLTRHLMLHVAW